MEKDYVVLGKEKLNILGFQIEAIRERFSNVYLNSTRFQPRCLRCCFNDEPNFCNYIRCNVCSGNIQTHFELLDKNFK